MQLIWGKDKAGYFSRGDWTGGIGLMRLAKSASAGSGICVRPGQGRVLRGAGLILSQVGLPTRGSIASI
jgi:hypothetical protein